LRNVGQLLLLNYEFTTFWELHGRFLILHVVGFNLPQEHKHYIMISGFFNKTIMFLDTRHAFVAVGKCVTQCGLMNMKRDRVVAQ
jgi:hypothetical protein